MSGRSNNRRRLSESSLETSLSSFSDLSSESSSYSSSYRSRRNSGCSSSINTKEDTRSTSDLNYRERSRRNSGYTSSTGTKEDINSTSTDLNYHSPKKTERQTWSFKRAVSSPRDIRARRRSDSGLDDSLSMFSSTFETRSSYGGKGESYTSLSNRTFEARTYMSSLIGESGGRHQRTGSVGGGGGALDGLGHNADLLQYRSHQYDHQSWKAKRAVSCYIS